MDRDRRTVDRPPNEARQDEKAAVEYSRDGGQNVVRRTAWRVEGSFGKNRTYDVGVPFVGVAPGRRVSLGGKK